MVLLVNQHTVPIFTDIANAFADEGEKTILFTGHIEKGGKPLSSNVRVIQSIGYNRSSSARRMLTWIVFSVHYFFYLLACRKPSRILVVTNPPLVPFVTALVSRWRNIRYDIVLYDLYPEALVQAQLLKDRHLLFRIWQKLNFWMFRNANTVFTLSESMKAAVDVYLPGQSQKIKVIHNWADTSYIHPILRTENAFVKTYRLENKTVVLYAGNMGLTHDLESVMEAAELLRHIPHLLFLFIGDGGKRLGLQKLAEKKSLNNVLFLPYQDSKNFPMAMAAADIGVVTLGAGAEGISVPSKTYVNLAAGVCVLAIAPASSELSRLIHEHEAGIVCVPGNAEKVAESIKELVENPMRLNKYKQNAIKASTLYTPENAKAYIRESHLT